MYNAITDIRLSQFPSTGNIELNRALKPIYDALRILQEKVSSGTAFDFSPFAIYKLPVWNETGGFVIIETSYYTLPIYDENNVLLTPPIDLLATQFDSNNIYNIQTASYTLTANDVSTLSNGSPIVAINSASANNLTIPPNSSVAFPVGAKIDYEQLGAGQTTIVGGSGVTVRGTPGVKCRAQYSPVTMVQKALNEWHCFGDLST